MLNAFHVDPHPKNRQPQFKLRGKDSTRTTWFWRHALSFTLSQSQYCINTLLMLSKRGSHTYKALHLKKKSLNLLFSTSHQSATDPSLDNHSSIVQLYQIRFTLDWNGLNWTEYCASKVLPTSVRSVALGKVLSSSDRQCQSHILHSFNSYSSIVHWTVAVSLAYLYWTGLDWTQYPASRSYWQDFGQWLWESDSPRPVERADSHNSFF